MVLITSSTDNITLKIDPAVVLATRKYVDDKVLELKVYVDDLMAKHLAANDPHTQYAPKASPTFTGTPKAPTPAAGNNSTQIANTAFVQAAIAALVASSPAALDTLNELAAALGNDPNFATTVMNALSGKQPLNTTLTNLSGKDTAGILQYLGLRESVSESVFFQLGDFQFVWGRGSTGSNGIGNVQFPHTFVGTPYLVAPSDISSGPEGVNAVGWDLSNSTAAGARIFSADSKSLGIATTFSYIAIGKGVV